MTNNSISEAAQIIKNGGLVAFPTETVYGLGANALNPFAVAKIFEMKERPSFDPLIVHIASFDDIATLSKGINENVMRLAKCFWPGPLTMVLERKKIVPDVVTAGGKTVAVRMPNHPLALQIIKDCGFPLAAPSANKSGRPSPTAAAHVREDFGDEILILDGGKTKVGLESTVIDLTCEPVVILREGGVTAVMLEKILGYLPKKYADKSAENADVIKSPGLKYKHYAPQVPLLLARNSEAKMIAAIQKKIFVCGRKKLRVGVMCVRENVGFYKNAQKIISCGTEKNPHAIARNLFGTLRKFQKDKIDLILCENFADDGIGKAIKDRLERAASGVI